MTVEGVIKGGPIQIAWLVGETVTQAGDKLEAAINAASDFLPVTASNDTGEVTLSAKIAGPWGNDILFHSTILEGTGGTVVDSGSALSGGTTEPSFATVLGLVAEKEYDFIVPCVSNADAQSSSDTSNPGRVKTHINTYNTGSAAKLQQAIVGLTGALSSAKTGAAARNHEPMEYVFCLNAQSLGCEWAGDEAGARMRAEVDDPASSG